MNPACGAARRRQVAGLPELESRTRRRPGNRPGRLPAWCRSCWSRRRRCGLGPRGLYRGDRLASVSSALTLVRTSMPGFGPLPRCSESHGERPNGSAAAVRARPLAPIFPAIQLLCQRPVRRSGTRYQHRGSRRGGSGSVPNRSSSAYSYSIDLLHTINLINSVRVSGGLVSGLIADFPRTATREKETYG